MPIERLNNVNSRVVPMFVEDSRNCNLRACAPLSPEGNHHHLVKEISPPHMFGHFTPYLLPHVWALDPVIPRWALDPEIPRWALDPIIPQMFDRILPMHRCRLFYFI